MMRYAVLLRGARSDSELLVEAPVLQSNSRNENCGCTHRPRTTQDSDEKDGHAGCEQRCDGGKHGGRGGRVRSPRIRAVLLN